MIKAVATHIDGISYKFRYRYVAEVPSFYSMNTDIRMHEQSCMNNNIPSQNSHLSTYPHVHKDIKTVLMDH